MGDVVAQVESLPGGEKRMPDLHHVVDALRAVYGAWGYPLVLLGALLENTSMKTMAGAAASAFSKRSRTLLASTPTNNIHNLRQSRLPAASARGARPGSR